MKRFETEAKFLNRQIEALLGERKKYDKIRELLDGVDTSSRFFFLDVSDVDDIVVNKLSLIERREHI